MCLCEEEAYVERSRSVTIEKFPAVWAEEQTPQVGASLSRRALMFASIPAPTVKSTSPLVSRFDLQAEHLECNFADLMCSADNSDYDALAYATSLIASHKELMRMAAREGQTSLADMQAMQHQLVVYDALIQQRWPETETSEHSHSA